MAKKRKLKPRTRNAGTMTDSMLKTMITAALRNKSRWWKPAQLCITNARSGKRIETGEVGRKGKKKTN